MDNSKPDMLLLPEKDISSSSTLVSTPSEISTSSFSHDGQLHERSTTPNSNNSNSTTTNTLIITNDIINNSTSSRSSSMLSVYNSNNDPSIAITSSEPSNTSNNDLSVNATSITAIGNKTIIKAPTTGEEHKPHQIITEQQITKLPRLRLTLNKSVVQDNSIPVLRSNHHIEENNYEIPEPTNSIGSMLSLSSSTASNTSSDNHTALQSNNNNNGIDIFSHLNQLTTKLCTILQQQQTISSTASSRKHSMSQDITEDDLNIDNSRNKMKSFRKNHRSVSNSQVSSQCNSDTETNEPSEHENSSHQRNKIRKTELKFIFSDSEDDLGENEHALVDKEENVPVPSLIILRNITRKTTNDSFDSRKKIKSSGPLVGSTILIEGSNCAVSKGSLSHTIAHRLSEGCIVGCECCLKAYESYWNRPRKQAKMKRLKVGLQHGYIDICDSDIFAVEALSGLSSEIVRQASLKARNAVQNENDEIRTTLDTISGGLPVHVHESIQARLLSDLYSGKLTASIDWPRRVIWILVCSEWEIRTRQEKGTKNSKSKRKTEQNEGKTTTRQNTSSTVKSNTDYNASLSESSEESNAESDGESASDDANHESSRLPLNTSNAQSRRPGRRGRRSSKTTDNHDGAKQSQYRRPFRIKLRDVRAYLPLGEAQYAPTLDDDENDLDANNNPKVSEHNHSSTTLTSTVDIVNNNSINNSVSSTVVSTTTGSSLSTSTRSLRSTQGSLSNISLKHGKCPFTETDAIHALIRINYKAPHYIDLVEEKGRCVFSGGFLPRGAFFCEYGGQLLNEDDARLREARYNREGGIHGAGCYSYYFRHPTTRLPHCIDATAERKEYGIGRLLSHSMRHPNLACKVYIVDGIPRLVLHTKIDILFGDEMKYDYGERSEIVLAKFEWLRE